jgi:penicillin-binding protein 1C
MPDSPANRSDVPVPRTSSSRPITVALIALIAVEVLLLGLDAAFPPDLGRAERSSPVALDRRGTWLRALPVENGRWRIRADLERTDPVFLARLVRIEDARFAWHGGVDPLAAARAAASALIHGRVTSGASTLTMQTAKLLEPRPRTLGAKLAEAARAVQLEARFSKREIIALYLTLTPYGGNLEGVRAASLAWFGHEPQSLTNGEQALLIALPQSPETRRPDRHPAAARAARHQVLAKMVRARLIDGAEASEADAEPLPRRAPFPALAWHAAGELARAAPSGQASVVTTIDAALQRRLEPLAAGAARGQGAAAQVAILAVEVNTRAVRAAVGSAALGRAGGWIDMTRALRSPGSALKPLIYGFAFDDGVATPDTQIDDAPRRFADYQPEDFDRVFHGPVTAREALIHSLNVPAVALLDKIGAAVFEAKVQAAGARLARPKAAFSDAGLALALGGEGITLRDLVLLYAALGDGGLAKPLAWTEGDAARREGAPGVRLMRPDAARQVLDILREAPTPKGRAPSALMRGGPAIAFKTGTSYGFRDAVAVGVVGGWAIAVWTGRADGGARGGLTGHDAALPLLFDVADEIAAPASAPRTIAPRAAPQALQRLARGGDGPRLIFPPDGAIVQTPGLGPTSRGLVLAAEGEALAWYVDGVPVRPDGVNGQSIWRPANPGFYRVTVVDAAGHEAQARVRVKGPRG